MHRNLKIVAMIGLVAGAAAFARLATADPPATAAGEKAPVATAPVTGTLTSAAIDQKAPDFSLAGIDGKTYKLSDFKGKYVVLEWNNLDCPFVKKHYGSGNMQALQKKYTDKGVVWLTICSSAQGKQGYYEPAALQDMTKERKLSSTAYLRDADGTVGKEYGAKTTPSMFVVNPDGNLIYAGAIDDKPSTDPNDIPGANNYVAACLDASLAGKPVATHSTVSYGCSVKYAN
ncbi:MAG TPA: thioredoxin family protein [Candidatus Krumholzibacteria bacterium]|nr:thioredoxin family protein [Candidatus Krumholzibacteria bacterium]